MANNLEFKIPAPNITLMTVKIVGTNSLIFHKWSDKAKKMILAKQQKKIVANKGHEIRNPEQDYLDSVYLNSDKKVSFPALSIKQAMVNSARSIEGLPMTLLRGCVFVVGDKDGFIEVKHEGKAISEADFKAHENGIGLREDMVRVGMGTADLRYRAEVKQWSMDFLIKHNADVISGEQVVNLLQIAGFSSGLGEWRPEKNGDSGTFEVVKISPSALPNVKE